MAGRIPFGADTDSPGNRVVVGITGVFGRGGSLAMTYDTPLNFPIASGQKSVMLCHLGNVSQRLFGSSNGRCSKSAVNRNQGTRHKRGCCRRGEPDYDTGKLLCVSVPSHRRVIKN